MMRDTPRIFIGTVTLRLQAAVCGHLATELHERVRACDALLPGVRVSHFDSSNAVIMVTADRPADRAEVVAALHRLGCPVAD